MNRFLRDPWVPAKVGVIVLVLAAVGSLAMGGEPATPIATAITAATLESPAYDAELRRFAAEVEARRVAATKARRSVALIDGAGFVAPLGALATWTQHATTRCTAACDMGCDRPNAPAGCQAPNCSAVISPNCSIPSANAFDAAARLAICFGTPPRAMGCRLWGASGETYASTAALTAKCLRGDLGFGSPKTHTCRPTDQERLTAEAIYPRTDPFFTSEFPAPGPDADGDGVFDAGPNADQCPTVPGLFPSGCPASSGPPTGGGGGSAGPGEDPLCASAEELEAYLDLKCRWEDAPTSWKAFCAFLRPVLSAEQEAQLACELRRWFHEMGRTSGQVCR